MGRGRKPTWTCTEEEFKLAIIKYSIKPDGTKRSVRELLVLPEFMEETGYYKVNPHTGERMPRALGSLSHFIETRGIHEKVVYDWHVEHGNISYDVSYEDWSRMNNRSGDTKEREFSLDRYDWDKAKECIKKVVKDIDFIVKLDEYSRDSKIKATWKRILDDKHWIGRKEEIYSMFREYYKEM